MGSVRVEGRVELGVGPDLGLEGAVLGLELDAVLQARPGLVLGALLLRGLDLQGRELGLGDEAVLQEHVEQSLIVRRRRFGADCICRFGGALLTVGEGLTLGLGDDPVLEQDIEECFVGGGQWAREQRPQGCQDGRQDLGVVVHSNPPLLCRFVSYAGLFPRQQRLYTYGCARKICTIKHMWDGRA